MRYTSEVEVVLTPESVSVLNLLLASHPEPVSHIDLERTAAVARLSLHGPLIRYRRITYKDGLLQRKVEPHYELTDFGLIVAQNIPHRIPQAPFVITVSYKARKDFLKNA